ncbi:MAG TPA: cupin domain-containing protein [Parasulfuritortus sp.]
MHIELEHNPNPDRLHELGVENWPTWGAGVSRFPWTYDEQETCYVLAGEVVVTPNDGAPVTVKAGDLATFPAGMSCTWDVRLPIRKHYRFG